MLHVQLGLGLARLAWSGLEARLGWAEGWGLGWAGLGLGWTCLGPGCGLGWAGPGWAGPSWAGPGWVLGWAEGWAGPGWGLHGLGWAGADFGQSPCAQPSSLSSCVLGLICPLIY